MASLPNSRTFFPRLYPIPLTRPDETSRKSQAELPGLNLKSSATLGTGRASSHREMLDRVEDKQVRRVAKKTRLDPMIDEDSDEEEDCSFPSADATEPSHTFQTERPRRPRTPDTCPVAEGTETIPAFVGSALRKNADGSIATPKVLPKRNKGSKVVELLWLVLN